MDKGSIKKEDRGISPLTPCRPVGLRRKYSGIKNLNSPSLNSMKTRDITSPISINAGSMNARILTDQIAPANNVKDCSSESGVTKELNEFGGNDCKKRKCTTPLSTRVIRKVVHGNSASCATTVSEGIIKTLWMAEEKSGLVKNDSCITRSKDFDVAKRHETAISQPLSPTIPVITKPEDFLEKRFISDAEINTLREQIAVKEKKLKELELAALYKKKHDYEHVAKEIECWLQGSKEALYALQSELAKRNQSYSLHELLIKLRIPSSLLELDEDSE